jgi:hypothetical protein
VGASLVPMASWNGEPQHLHRLGAVSMVPLGRPEWSLVGNADERKVRTSQSSMPRASVGVFSRLAGEGNGKCHRKDTALHSLRAVKGKGEMVR